MTADLLRALRFRLAKILHRKRLGDEIHDELQFHLDALAEDNRARGMTEQEARLAAIRALGGATSTREAYHEQMTFPLMESMMRDIWYGWRALRRSPAFTLTAVVVLGLGIGLNVGLISIIRALCYQPLPLPDAARIVGITRGHRVLSYELFEALRDQGKEQLDVAAYDPYATVQVGGTAKSTGGMARAMLVSDNFFRVLNARPRFGDLFAPGQAVGAPSAVLSYRLAGRYFGGDASPVGQTIRLNQRLFTVIGVMPAGFQGPDLMVPDLWVRLGDEGAFRPGYDIRRDPDARRLILVGHLLPGVTAEQAMAALQAIAARVPERHPETQGIYPIALRPAVLFPLNSDMLPFVFLLMAPTGMVLLIACANLANLLLSRASRRGKEMATRLALGAGRGRLIRQLMTESVLLALLGGVAGTLFAGQLLQTASGFLNEQATGMGYALPTLRLDAGVWACMIGISLLAAVACGITPALHATRQDLASAARQDSGGARGSRIRNALMIAQVAVCTVLLCAAGLMIRSFQRSLSTDPGFATERVIAVQYNLASAGYSPARAAAFERQVFTRLSAARGAREVAQAASPPLSDRPVLSVIAIGGERRATSSFNRVSPEFFSLFGIAVLAGRPFNAAETASGAPVAMVSLATARRLWPNESAVGKRFRIQDETASPAREVIGIAADTRSIWLSRVDENYIYLPFDAGATDSNVTLVHVDRDTPTVRSELNDTIRAIDPEAPVSIQSMGEVLNRWRLLPLAGSTLAMVLALVALALAGVGMYGVMAYLVGQRQREFGIRMALGAGRRAILSMVFRQGLGIVAVGLGLGLVGAASLARILMGSFYGLSPYDPPAFLFVISFVGTAALASMYGPANRAAKVDPVSSLRQE